MSLKDKLQQGFASAAGVLVEVQLFIAFKDSLKRDNDLKNVINSIEKIIDDLEWCKNIINEYNKET